MPKSKNQLILKAGREKSVLARHPWIFSGAIASEPEVENGAIVQIVSSQGAFLGRGFYSKKSQIRCRLFTFEDAPFEEVLLQQIQSALFLRKAHFNPTITNAYRLINAEGDFLPGLIVDKYADSLVMQISIVGMEKQKEMIAEILRKECKSSWIYEKSTAASRQEEGLQPFEKTLFGVEQDVVRITEDGLLFDVSPIKGQKTGFFLDQRQMRQLVQTLGAHKRVLNCFGYTGAFSVHALHGGATLCDSIDISNDAVEMMRKNIALNKLDMKIHREMALDVFQFLKSDALDYDLVILDPPAFAKRKHDVPQAARGYKEINRLAMQKMPPKSYLLTASCSYHVDEKLFRQILFSAAKEAKRNVRLLQGHRLAFDHPQSIYHPESNYLKSFLCYLD